MKFDAKSLMVGAGILAVALAVPVWAAPKKSVPAAPAPGIGLYARIDTVTKDGFTSTQYRAGDLSLHTWKTGSVVVRGATTSKLVNGEYWHGRVEDAGVELGPAKHIQVRVYKVLVEFGGK